MELPLRVSDGGDESEEVEPSGCCEWLSRPKARAKLVTDRLLSLVASEFLFLRPSLLNSASAG